MKIRYIFLFAIIFFSACTHSHQHDEAEVPIEDENEVKLTSEQIKNIGLTYDVIQARNMHSIVKLNGRIELPPNGKSSCSSLMAGKISEVLVIAGDKVRTGQAVFTVQNLEIIDWQQALEESQAKIEYLYKELERQKGLVDSKISPVKTYELLTSEKLQLESRIKLLRHKLAALGVSFTPGSEFKSHFSVRAPASGVVQHLLVTQGQYIDATTTLAEIISNEHLHLHLLAMGAQVNTLKVGQQMSFFVQSRPEQILKAKIRWINPMVNEASNSYDIHVDITGALTGLSAGEYVEARIIEEEKKSNSLPFSAITEDMGLHYIFVKSHDSHEDEIHFEKLQVRLGVIDMDYVEVYPIDPIPADAEVVVTGAFMLMAQSKKGSEPAGHSH